MAPFERLSNKKMGLQQHPWITHDTLELINERDKFHKQYVTVNDSGRKAVIFRIYKSKRNFVVKMIRQSKNRFYSEFFNRNENNSKKVWEEICDVINNSKKCHTFPKKKQFFYKMSFIQTMKA